MLACNESGGRRQKEGYRKRSLLGAQKAVQGNIRKITLTELVTAHGFRHGGFHNPIGHTVDANSVSPPLARRAHGQPKNSRFSSPVVDLTDGTFTSGVGGNIHYCTWRGVAISRATNHFLPHRLQHVKSPRQVDVDDRLPFLARHFLNHRSTGYACIIDQSVDSAESLHTPFDCGVDKCSIGNAAGEYH